MQLSLVLNYIWQWPINLAHTYAHVYYHIFSINQFSHSHVCTTTNQGWELQHRTQAKQSIHFTKICKSTIYIQFALGATAIARCTTGEQMSVCTTSSGPDFAAECAVSAWEERTKVYYQFNTKAITSWSRYTLHTYSLKPRISVPDFLSYGFGQFFFKTVRETWSRKPGLWVYIA